MSITTYSELKTALADWLNRADLDQRIPDFIALAEATLNKVMRSYRMIDVTTLSIGTARKVALPSDFIDALYVQDNSDEDNPLEQVTIEQLVMLRRARLRDPGTPRFFAIVGENLEVAPTPSTSTTLELNYYAKIPALSDSNTTNWLLTHDADVYLYTALLHAVPFLHDDARLSVLENLITKQVTAAVQTNQVATFDSGRIGSFSLNKPADQAQVIG